MPQIGDTDTEQFNVETLVNGETVRLTRIHDPFIHTTVVTKLSRWDHFKGIFRPPETKTQVVVRASEGAQRAIMTMDPVQLARDSEDILECRRQYQRAIAGMSLAAQLRCPLV